VSFKKQITQQLHARIWPLLDAGKLKPVIYKTFALDQAADAHRLMESSEHVGKIVLTV
jgi:NADPH2:quinone reductase